MFKTLIKTYIESRLNAIDAEVEDLADKITEEEEKANEKSVIAQATFTYNSTTLQRIKKLQRRVILYNLIFGEIK